MNALVARDTVPGRTDMWGDYLKKRGNRTEEIIANTAMGPQSSGIGTPEDMRAHLTGFQAAGVDQVIFLQQAGRNRHEHICESLELFAAEVMPAFKQEVEAREAKKRAELAPWVEAALARKKWMQPLGAGEVPVVQASVPQAQFNQSRESATK